MPAAFYGLYAYYLSCGCYPYLAWWYALRAVGLA